MRLMIRRAQNRSRKGLETAASRVSSRKGFSLPELLVTMAVMIMASAVLTQALSFAYRAYRVYTGNTEAQLLCDTVSTLLKKSLSEGNPNAYSVEENGILCAKTDGSSSYPIPASSYGYSYQDGGVEKRARNVTFSVTSEPSDENLTYYAVVVTVNDRSGIPLASNRFTVRPFLPPSPTPASPTPAAP